MIPYRVFVQGSGVGLRVEGAVGRYGFYTTRYFLAASSGEAQSLAFAAIRQELRESSVLDTCELRVEEIAELDSFEGVDAPGRGFTFYPEGSE